MVPISISYLGDLRGIALHGPSRTGLITDAPVDNHGKGESFSPTDLVATSLASCILTTMAIVAQRDGLRLDGATAAVEKHMSSQPPRKIAKIVVRLALPPGIPLERQKILERAAHTCPVALSLHPEVEQIITFQWRDC